MKNSVVCAVLLVLILALCVPFSLAEPPVGGWSITHSEPGALPEEAQAAFDKAVKDLDHAQYIPVALMATQVVAGTNYCILSQIVPAEPDARPSWALVYIYADLQGNAEIMNVYELYIDRHSAPANYK